MARLWLEDWCNHGDKMEDVGGVFLFFFCQLDLDLVHLLQAQQAHKKCFCFYFVFHIIDLFLAF